MVQYVAEHMAKKGMISPDDVTTYKETGRQGRQGGDQK
jgi:hypothetical protein